MCFIPSVPENSTKDIIRQTLQAVLFCHNHNVSVGQYIFDHYVYTIVIWRNHIDNFDCVWCVEVNGLHNINNIVG